MGVTVTNHAMVTHCRTLTQACSYTEGKNKRKQLSHNVWQAQIMFPDIFMNQKSHICYFYDWSWLKQKTSVCTYTNFYVALEGSAVCTYAGNVRQWLLCTFVMNLFARWGYGVCIRLQERDGTVAWYTFGESAFHSHTIWTISPEETCQLCLWRLQLLSYYYCHHGKEKPLKFLISMTWAKSAASLWEFHNFVYTKSLVPRCHWHWNLTWWHFRPYFEEVDTLFTLWFCFML